MIDDLPAARPQSGLASASVVWQAPAEGGIPRYMAIFQDDMPERSGPVRSCPLLLHRLGGRVASGLRPRRWLAAGDRHAPRQGQRPARLQRRRVPLRRVVLPLARGGGSRRTTSYAKGSTLRNLGKRIGAKDKAYKPVWQFAPDAPLDARPYGGTITVKYPTNTIKYKYDRKTNTYLRSVTGEKKQTDAGDGRRVAPKNVVVMMMSFGPLNDGHPNKHRLEATVIGSGVAWISTNGRTIKGTWKKTALTKPTRFYDSKGKEVTLTIGQTFIQVMPLGSPVSVHVPDPTRLPRRPRRRRPRRPRRPVRPRPARSSAGAPPFSVGAADPDLGVDRPGLARHVRPGPALPVGPLAGVRRDPAMDAGRRPRPCASATARRSGSRGSTRIPAPPTRSGSAPDGGRDDRRPAGDRLDRPAGRPPPRRPAGSRRGRRGRARPRRRPGGAGA